MARAKSRPKNPFIGTWYIVSISNWDEGQLNEENDAFIEFDDDGGGSFEFADIQGSIDHYRTKKKDRQRAVQFGWHGEDEEGIPIDDIGWALLEDGELRGTICLHLGEEEIEFVAKKESKKTSSRGEQQQTKEKPKLKRGKSSAFVKTNHRFASLDDVAILAEMNRRLIEDEGHRNSMTVKELEHRMRSWLTTDYQAVVFQHGAEALGYALFKQEPEWLYLRQFFVRRETRRRGIGRNAIRWLLQNAWGDAKRIRLDVLIGNSGAIQFWRSVGFEDYCLTMERR